VKRRERKLLSPLSLSSASWRFHCTQKGHTDGERVHNVVGRQRWLARGWHPSGQLNTADAGANSDAAAGRPPPASYESCVEGRGSSGDKARLPAAIPGPQTVFGRSGSVEENAAVVKHKRLWRRVTVALASGMSPPLAGATPRCGAKALSAPDATRATPPGSGNARVALKAAGSVHPSTPQHNLRVSVGRAKLRTRSCTTPDAVRRRASFELDVVCSIRSASWII